MSAANGGTSPAERGGDLSLENQRLRAQLTELREQLEAAVAEQQRLSAELVAAEQQAASFVKLHVTNRRLNEATDRADVLAAIQEIIVSVIGSECFAIFELEPDRTHLSLAASFGVESAGMQRLALTSAECAPLRAVLESGSPWFSAPAKGRGCLEDRSGPVAYVPLTVGSNVVGIIAVYSLLAPKADLDASDRPLLTLLGLEAARALSSLRAVA